MIKAAAAVALSIAALLSVPVANAEPGDGLDANRLTCDLWAQGVPPSAIFDRLVRDFGLSGEDALGLIDSANPDHSFMCSEV
jgi:hypothetical protein